MRKTISTVAALAALLAAGERPAARAQAPGPVTALVGGTVIDGNGGAPLADAIVLIAGGRVLSVGPRNRVPIPPDARQVDARGQWILPGLIDTNVHLSLYGGQNDRYETLARYQPRQDDIVLEAAQIDLSYGITTVRDSYGALLPLTKVRDAIARGDTIGARILAAGNILGWSGPYSFSFSRVMGQLTLFQEQMNDFIAQGGGEELMAMRPDEIGHFAEPFAGRLGSPANAIFLTRRSFPPKRQWETPMPSATSDDRCDTFWWAPCRSCQCKSNKRR